ncbi:hypothetical protein ISS07_03830 [Candidatus Woesearchaeota archaeon]|nr:hypothetical protein [Candidatus Woesearchaeota archaeon]
MTDELSMQGNLEINEKEGVVLVSVNPKIYPLDVVLSSAYMFTNNNYVLVDGDPSEEIIVELRPKEKKDVEKVGREFNNELINYANYTVQAIKNQGLREAILNRVLKTSDVSSREEDVSYLETEAKPWKFDPEEIAKPWNDKHGEDKDTTRKE